MALIARTLAIAIGCEPYRTIDAAIGSGFARAVVSSRFGRSRGAVCVEGKEGAGESPEPQRFGPRQRTPVRSLRIASAIANPSIRMVRNPIAINRANSHLDLGCEFGLSKTKNAKHSTKNKKHSTQRQRKRE